MELRLQGGSASRLRKGQSVMRARGKLTDLYVLVGIIVRPLDMNNIRKSKVVLEYI